MLEPMCISTGRSREEGAPIGLCAKGLYVHLASVHRIGHVPPTAL